MTALTAPSTSTMPGAPGASDAAAADLAVEQIAQGRELAWVNPRYLPFDTVRGLCDLAVSDADIADAASRLERFAPFIERVFPETRPTGGLIESPLREIPAMQDALAQAGGTPVPGRLFLKMDSHLAIAGSVKARGGIYEVLKHAEDLALEAGLIGAGDDYAALAEPTAREFFGRYTVQVGSTVNLGLSIGIASAAVGFRAVVHMSADAKQWKKDLLRSKGVEVIEYADDYSRAVREGRAASDADPASYFVDDERSVDLFCGYAVAAGRLKAQLDAAGVSVDAHHPLLVFIPAGVGGAPGGVAYGLKHLFGDAVHCFFCEPVECPSVTLGIATQLFERANVRDFGLSGQTEADGLACAAPSGFVTRIMTNLLSGSFTVSDAHLFDYLRLLHASESVEIEPSSCAAFAGPAGLLAHPASAAYCTAQGLDAEALASATLVAWATGGALVPPDIRTRYLETHL